MTAKVFELLTRIKMTNELYYPIYNIYTMISTGAKHPVIITDTIRILAGSLIRLDRGTCISNIITYHTSMCCWASTDSLDDNV